MANLTTEYLDKQLGKIDKRFDGLDKRLDKEFKSIDGKFSFIDKRFDSLDKKIDSKIDDLAIMTAKGFENVIKRLDVKERLEKLEKRMDRVFEALNI